MKILRPDQKAALDTLRDRVAEGGRRLVMQAPTGFGKTVLASSIVEGALAKKKRVLFVVPAIVLIDQTVQMFHDQGISEVGVIQATHDMTDWSQPVQVASVMTLRQRKTPEADVVVIDEVHRWFKYYEKLLTDPEWQNTPIIGMSATPWTRGLGAYFDSEPIVASTTRRLIDGGFLSPFKVFAPSHPDLKGVTTFAGDYHEGQLSERMNKRELVADIVQTWIKLALGRPTLCFAVNIEHAKNLQQQFIDAGVRAGYQDAHTKANTYTDRSGVVREGRDSIKRKFHSGELEVVVNVGTLTTGVDWDVRAIICARPTKSEMLFCLDSETEILTSHGWRGIDEIKVGDCAAAMSDTATGNGCWSRVTATIRRAMTSEEKWVSYEAPRVSFRVTDNHKMVFAPRKEDSYRIDTAGVLAGYRDSVIMPTAIKIDQPGVPLNDAELYFIGMMMTDGTWTSTSASISQSERHPEIILRIEECLRRCSIGYSKRRIASPPDDAVIKEKFSRWQFNFSAGKPRGHHNLGRGPMPTKRPWEIVAGKTGYGHLLPFMDKDFAPALMLLSRAQFLVLLQGIHDGDGFKLKSPSVDWTPRSWTICSSRKIFIDRLQALAAINGFTGNVRREHSQSRKNPIWYITITPQDWRSVGGVGDSFKIITSGSTIEDVWCVETETGTIVTRRHGKVTVMGNCQMIGRGLRTAEGKDFCLILDHSDNHDRLGFVTDIDEAHANGDLNKGDTPVKNNSVIGIRLPKECKKCAYLKPPKTAVCPSCGYKDESHGKGAVVKEGDLTELKNKRKLPVVIGTKEEVYGGLLWMAKEKGYKPGWVANQYREVFEVWPYNGIEIKAPMCRPSLLLTEWVRRKQKNYRIRRGYAGSNNGNSNGALTQRQQSFIDNVAKKFAPNTLMTKDDMEIDL